MVYCVHNGLYLVITKRCKNSGHYLSNTRSENLEIYISDKLMVVQTLIFLFIFRAYFR